MSWKWFHPAFKDCFKDELIFKNKSVNLPDTDMLHSSLPYEWIVRDPVTNKKELLEFDEGFSTIANINRITKHNSGISCIGGGCVYHYLVTSWR